MDCERCGVSDREEHVKTYTLVDATLNMMLCFDCNRLVNDYLFENFEQRAKEIKAREDFLRGGAIAGYPPTEEQWIYLSERWMELQSDMRAAIKDLIKPDDELTRVANELLKNFEESQGDCLAGDALASDRWPGIKILIEEVLDRLSEGSHDIDGDVVLLRSLVNKLLGAPKE